jgi:hypothetical protein
MTNNRTIVNLEQVTDTCFVIMPFHALFDSEYERVIRPAIRETGLECVRGNEIYSDATIVQDIWRSLRQARVIVAELSGRNPNVLYEVGLAHAIGKPIVLLTRNQEDVPFDLRTLRYLLYDPNDPFWGENLHSKLTDLLRKVLNTPSYASHLRGVEVQVDLPEIPRQPLSPPEPEIPEHDFNGVWKTTWISIKKQREHEAQLVIPPKHGRNFMATMTVGYMREGQRTIVQETLAGPARGSDLSLTGVNYTYVERGSSRAYSLDAFELRLSDNGKKLAGEARLRHGTRNVEFYRLPDPIGR